MRDILRAYESLPITNNGKLEQILVFFLCFFPADEQVAPTTPMTDSGSGEDAYIGETSLPPYAVYDSDNRLIGMSVETFTLEMLKAVEVRF